MKIKMKRSLLLLSVFCLVLFAIPLDVNALTTGFSTEELNEEQKDSFSINAGISPLSDEPEKDTIVCFDVNDNGLIAIGQETWDKKIVSVYSSDGVFQYGYTFVSSGSIGVEWDENNINIYFVRSGVIASVNSSGEVLDIKEVQDTTENNSYYYRFFRVAERTVGDTTYLIRSNMGILNWITASYSQVVVKEFDGTENIIYDASSIQLQRMTIIFIAILLFLAIFIWRIYCYYCKSGR